MGGGGWAWELHWGEVKPFPRSVGAEGGRRRGLHGEVGAAAALLTGGGVPAWLGDGGRAEELQDAERKLARGLVGGEEERTRGLRVEVGSAASNDGRRCC